MPDFHWNELISAEHLDAFAAMWPQEREAASAEVRRLLDLVSKPTEHLNETRAFARRLLLGLVGEEPDVAAWMQAVAAGGLQLRPEQRYVVMRDREKPARFLERGLETYDHGVTARQERAGITDEGVKQGMHLVAFLLLAKEFKNLAAGPAALGPAWPLMVAVNSYLTNDEKRTLHIVGADKELQQALAEALKNALAPYAGMEAETRAANWRRELPPTTDLQGFFNGKAACASSIDEDAADDDLETIEKNILSGPRPSFLPTEIAKRWPKRYSLPTEFQTLLPQSSDEFSTYSKGMRAVARQNARERAVKARSSDVQSTDFKVQVWLRFWVMRGGGIPPEIPLIFLGYLEEEACLAFETYGDDWPFCDMWKNYCVIGSTHSRLQPASMHEYYDQHRDFSWNPPRIIDRIDVNSLI